MGCLFSKTKSIPENIDPKSLPIFVPAIRHCRVIKCYDGDTITVAAYYTDDKLYKFQVRIAGIDCPEIKSSNQNEKEVAIVARDLVKDLILGEMVELVNVKTEKYGRLLADVLYKNQSIANMLLQEHLAVEYEGKTKAGPSDWKKYRSASESKQETR
tara:strand:+ start:398 stop:868 length:471 start_codon:yes stop_codon:yes gene_type:complete